jgi:adenosylcobinamide-GDP ribazoletransferase
MKKEFRIFLAALMFFTRIPVPPNNPADLNKASRYFPLVGIIVGLIGAAAFTASMVLFRNNLVAVFISLGATLLTTGAFHEDGLADVADGFGGGWTKVRIMEIMKDSRVGAYGVIALIVVIGIKVSLLSALCNNREFRFLLIYISAHAVSRIMPVFLLRFMQYSREDDTSKSKPLATKISVTGLMIAIISGLIPLVLLAIYYTPYAFVCLIPCGLLTWYLGRYFNKWINGYTGDCLGATQQLTEIVFYLSMLTICNYSL